MDKATLTDAILVERASSNNLLKEVDKGMDYWRTMLRFNREESKIIHEKIKQIEVLKDQIKWSP